MMTNENHLQDLSHNDRRLADRAAHWLQNNRVAQLLEIALVFSPVFTVVAIVKLYPVSNPIVFMASVWTANVAMLVLIALSSRLRGQPLSEIGLTFSQPSLRSALWFMLKSALIFVLAMLGFALGGAIMVNVVDMQAGADLSNYNYLRGNFGMFLASWIGVLFVSSFGEEVVYRGFLISRLEALFGSNPRVALVSAVVVSSLVFGVAHFAWGIVGIVQTSFMGLALATCYVVLKRNLWPLIAAHAIMDTLLLLQLFLA